ncbi:MAG: TolB family protein, partial [Candidatus Sericytochromatia bacterium]
MMPLKAMILGENKKTETSLEGEQVKRSIFSEKEDSKKSSVLTGGVLDYSWSPDSSTIVYTRIDADENGQADTVLGFRSVKIEKNQIKSKYLFDYEYKIFQENDDKFQYPLNLISSPIFSKDKRSIFFVAFENEENNIYQVNYRDFERKVKNIKAKKITNTNNFIFQELSLSPDGKKIAGRIGKTGDGGNIFILDLKSNDLNILTDTSVIYSNCDPSWSEDSKNIYFSSDHDDISNLYSINLEENKLYKLSNSFRGFEFPFYKDNYLYFTSFFAKGTDIRRFDVNKVKRESISDIKSYKLSEASFNKKTNHNYKTTQYVPWLTPDLIIPLTGVDERGDQLGARMSFSDMLYKHAVNAAVAYGLVSNKLTYGVGYVNRMF